MNVRTIKDMLYHKRKIGTPHYSHIPSEHISPERLIDGRAPFLSGEGSYVLVKKTLIVFAGIYMPPLRRRLTLAYRLDKLESDGFNIKMCIGGRLYDYNSEKLLDTLKQISLTKDTLTVEECAARLNIEANQILICDDELIKKFIEGDESDLEEFTPFKEIKLKKHYLSEKLYYKLIHDHADTIESLYIARCPNIPYVVSGLRLTSLTIGDNIYDEYGSAINIPWTNLLSSLDTSNLTHLNFHVSFPGKADLEKLSPLTHLKHLYLRDQWDVDGDVLEELLARCPALESLICRDIKLPEGFTFVPNPLPTLKEVNLLNVELGGQAYCLLEGADLHSLRLINSKVVIKNLNINYPSLKIWDVGDNELTYKQLLALNKSKQLRVLNVNGCRATALTIDMALPCLEELTFTLNAGNSMLIARLLSTHHQLKKIHLKSEILCPQELSRFKVVSNFLTDITLDDALLQREPFRSIFEKSSAVKNMVLIDCVFLKESGSFNFSNYTALEMLTLSGCSFDVDSLERLITAAPNLQQLTIRNCEISFDKDFVIPHLSSLQELSVSTTNIDSKIFNNFISGAKNLRKLIVMHCHKIDACLEDRFDLRELKSIIVTTSSIPSAMWLALLSSASKLEHLETDQLNITSFPPSKCTTSELREYHFPELVNLYITLQPDAFLVLHGLIKAATKLEVLKVCGLNTCGVVDVDGSVEAIEDVFALPQFTKLHTISLSCQAEKRMVIDENFLRKLLTQAADTLTTLSLSLTYLMNAIELKPYPRFSTLHTLDLNNSTISAELLNVLLLGADNLQKLVLLKTCISPENVCYQFSLPRLTKVNLATPTQGMNVHLIKSLLGTASLIDTLDLSHCIWLTEGDFRDLYEKYPYINITPPANLARLTDAQSFTPLAQDVLNGGSISQSASTIIDADTSHQLHTFTVERQFLSDPIPPVALIRLDAYNKAGLNPYNRGLVKPFLLENTPHALDALVYVNVNRVNSALIDVFNKKPKQYHFGRFNFLLTSNWQRLPSVLPDDVLTHYTSPVAVEIKYSPTDAFYYIKLKPDTKKNQNSHNVVLELLYKKSCHNQLSAYNALPPVIRELVVFCRGFRNEQLEIVDTATAQDCLNALISQRNGACRHRAVVFAMLLKEKCPDIPCQIITNVSHAFIEIFYKQWLTLDLGGYSGRVDIKNTLLADINESPQDLFSDIGSRYSQTFSRRGASAPANYFQRAQNLTILKFEHSNSLYIDHTLPLLETLEVTSCSFSAKELNKLFEYVPNLKTLVIAHGTMGENEFRHISLQALSKLEHVTLRGSFIPNAGELALVIKSAKTNPKWVLQELSFQFAAGDVAFADHAAAVSPHSPESAVVISENEGTSELGSAAKPVSQSAAAGPVGLFPSVSSLPTINLNIKHAERYLPKNRYIPTMTREKKQATSLLTYLASDWKSGLLDFDDTERLRLALQALCIKTKRPNYFVQHPDELRCGSAYIHRDGDIGSIKPGPGGALYAFFQQYAETDSILFIDLSKHFEPAAMVAFVNCLLDDIPSVDGVLIPARCRIIAIANLNDASFYKGADFYSRLQFQDKVAESELNKVLASGSDAGCTNAVSTLSQQPYEIELAGGSNWQARLHGSWLIEGQKLTFKRGMLVDALQRGVTHVVLNNAPLNDSEFTRFINDLTLHNAILHNGRRECELPPEFSISYANHCSFNRFANRLSLNLDSSYPGYPLNLHTVADFLGKYHCDTTTNGLIFKPGLIEMQKDSVLTLCVTDTLSELKWLSLLELAVKFNVLLNISLTSNATLPTELIQHNQALLHRATILFAKQSHTQFVTRHTLPAIENAIIIEASELDRADLLPSLKNDMNKTTGAFHFSDNPGFLAQNLMVGKTVILKGRLPDELAMALHPLIFTRMQLAQPPGRLIFVSDRNPFTFVAAEESQKALITPPLPSRAVEYDERYRQVRHILKRNSMLIIEGETGVGKTDFIINLWKKTHSHCYIGEENILNWIHDQHVGLKTLFIDEANMAPHLAKFKGLLESPPVIFYKGQYHPLTNEPDNKHVAIFAKNSLRYAGERQAHDLFESITTIAFKKIPRAVIADTLDLPSGIADIMLDRVGDADYITPREVLMMAILTKSASIMYPAIKTAEWARYFTYTLMKPHVPSHQLAAFEASHAVGSPIASPDKIGDLIVTSSNQEAVQSLTHQLDLRDLRKRNTPAIPTKGGLSGLIFEGDPGVGKSKLVMQCLNARGLKVDIDYYYLPVTLSAKVKQARLINAFHEGKIVVIEEANSCPSMERLLNALLEGYDLEGNRPNIIGHDANGKPLRNLGFTLLITQNQATNLGRNATPLPILHRLGLRKVLNPTEVDLHKILAAQGLPYRIADDMIREFFITQKEIPTICTRDLFKAAQRWLVESDKYASSISVYPMIQLGHVCKLTAIENVECYYAMQLGFTPMPLFKSKVVPYSIRLFAKQNGSVQGEVLEFERWHAVLNQIGYDAEIVECQHDMSVFFTSIIRALRANNLPLVAFAVDRQSGLPDPHPVNADEQEHAAVITAYHPHTDEVTMVHWGRAYKADLVTLFNSNQSLTNRRNQEFYKLNSLYQPGVTPKYLLQTASSQRNSITPRDNTGFRGKLLIVQQPDVETLLSRRQLSTRRIGSKI